MLQLFYFLDRVRYNSRNKKQNEFNGLFNVIKFAPIKKRRR